MSTIDKIRELKISDIGREDLKLWLLEELDNLASDLGQKMDPDQISHIPGRMISIFQEKYRNWEAGKIHSIFQKGITGSYGKVSKITVSNLLTWITQEDRASRGENVHSFEPEPEYTKEQLKHFDETANRNLPFIKHCHENGIDLSELNYEQWRNLRDRFNRVGASEMRYELDQYPKYRNYEIVSRFKF